MALRDQPYIPLYVQDIMTDERLNECSAATHGIYIKGIMCLMHKSVDYGRILLKQRYKREQNKCLGFGKQLARHTPYTADEIASALDELLAEGVCYLEDDQLCQKRMIKDNTTSIARAKAGSKGGKKTQKFAKANTQATSENESEDENKVDLTKVTADFENSFNIFWNAYDKKRGFDWCRDAWFGNIKLTYGKKLSNADRKAILANVPAYVKSTPKKSKRKDPKTYLNNRAWLDEIIEIEETTPMWPRTWSKEFENTLQPKPLQAWRKFLRDECGLKPVMKGTQTIKWVPKEENHE